MNYTFTWLPVLAYDNLCFTSTGASTIGFKLDSNENCKATLYISKDEQDW